MTKMILSNVRKFGCMMVAGLAISLAPVSARADAGFKQWINQFYATAAKEGISKATYQKAFAGVSEPDPDALRKATFQPEFTTQIWDYLDSRVNPYTVRIGREMKMKHATTLNWIERNFNVDKHIILAIWSMESNYGAVLEKPERLHNIPQALATLAYSDPKRAKFARTQLIAALKILQAGDVTPKQPDGFLGGGDGPYPVHSDQLPALCCRCGRQR